MNRPDLIALDLDGTLLDAESRITERARQAVERCAAEGAHVVICTGRPPRMTHAYAETLGVETSIVYNGASRLHHGDGTLIHHHELSSVTAGEVVERLRTGIDGVQIGLETAAGWFVDRPLFEASRERLAKAGLPPPDGVGAVESFLDGGAIKVFARHPEHGVEALAGAVEGLPVYATWSGPTLLEVMHPAVNKRDALERLSGELGIEREHVAAFGDNHNDLEMLAWAGHGVAVANATPAAIEAADEVAASHDEDGVAAVLERWFP
ncbi:MAG: Cof-type HAD-IIB family hydrolase [Planctomycetota bacterium]|nr:Cof-type HAD-IIB family hydrolase [Planctomycetota bacterium]